MLQVKMAQFSTLSGEQWLALTTFEHDGKAITTALRFAMFGDQLFVLAPADVVARIHDNAQVEVAPCTEDGEALGEPIEAMAVVLLPDKAANARKTLGEKYGLSVRLSALTMALRRAAGAYLEITPM
jgi:PPOX class probable F420-dependent enzyme